jgi:hypothetical protein
LYTHYQNTPAATAAAASGTALLLVAHVAFPAKVKDDLHLQQQNTHSSTHTAVSTTLTF